MAIIKNISRTQTHAHPDLLFSEERGKGGRKKRFEEISLFLVL